MAPVLPVRPRLPEPNRGFSTSQSVIDEEVEESMTSILERLEPTTEEEAAGQPEAFRKEWRQIDSIEKLHQFYEFNQQSLFAQGTGQQLLVLKRINKLWNNETKRHNSGKDPRETGAMRTKASAIQTQIVLKCLQNRTTLNVINTNALLVALAGSKLDRSMITKQDLEDLEQHLSYQPEVLSSDLGPALAAFIKLDHFPEKLLKEVISMNTLATFQPDGTYILLRQLINSQITSTPELFDKLWDRVVQTHTRVYHKRCASIINLIAKFQDLLPENQNANIQLMQQFIDRYAQILKSAQSQENIAMEVLWATNNVRNFIATTSNNLSDKELQSQEFFKECHDMIMSKASTMRPAQLLDVIKSSGEYDNQKKEMVKAVLKDMREDRCDIRAFNFTQFVSFVNLVSEFQPQDLQVFRKYADAAITQDFFKEYDLENNFGDFLGLMHTFALNGEPSDGAASYRLLLLLTAKATKATDGSNLDKMLHERLIDAVWTMIHRESRILSEMSRAGRTLSASDSNPLIPRLLEFLYSYKRDKPLTKQEYLQLYQINLWIENQVEDGRLPEEFAQCLPSHIKQQAAEKFHEYDKPFHQDTQTEIAKKLLKLRVTFRENQRLDKKYRADIKLLDQDILIMVHSEDENQLGAREQGAILGLEGLRQYWFSTEASEQYAIHQISAEQWKQMDEFAKLSLLSGITSSDKSKRIRN